MKTPPPPAPAAIIKLDANTIVEVESPDDPKDGPRLTFYVLDREVCPTARAADALAALLNADPAREL